MKKKLFQHKKLTVLCAAALSILLAAAVLISLLLFPSAAVEPKVTIKLNGAVKDIDDPIDVLTGDKIEVRINFQNTEAGASYKMILPEIFNRLSKDILEIANAAILPYIDFTLDYNPTSKKQTLALAFKENVLAASFTFVGTLNFNGTVHNVEKSITTEGMGELEIKLNPQPTPPPVNPPPGGVSGKPSAISGILQKYTSISTITDSNFFADGDFGGPLQYFIYMNTSMRKQDFVGTMSDEFPEGMRLFYPNAPKSAYNSSYADAYRSFSFQLWVPATHKDEAYDGDYTTGFTQGYHKDGEIWLNSGRQSTFVNAINQQEAAMGRTGTTYSAADVNWRINMTDGLAADLDNGQGIPATISNINVGYRLESDGKIHLYEINNAGSLYSPPYEMVRTEPWSDTSNNKCIPICNLNTYDISDISRASIITTGNGNGANSDFNIQVGSNPSPSSGFSIEERAPLEIPLPDGRQTYQWIYKYNGNELFKLNVIRDDVAGHDTIEYELNVTEGHYFYGKRVQFAYAVYFDHDRLTIPSNGKLVFFNKAKLNTYEAGWNATYDYGFGSAGAVITGAAKTVENTNKTYMNPEAADTAQTYAITFSKAGALDIAADSLNVFDILDKNLEYVNDSIKIYKETAANVWTDVTTSSGPATAQAAGGAASDLNLKVDYVPNQTGDKIAVTNTGQLSFAGKIKVEFDAKLKSGVKYGTKVPNYFGNTVNTFVDNKVAIKKTDKTGAIISAPAMFSVQYTTVSTNGFDFDLDYEFGDLAALTDSSGNDIGELTTDSGIAQAVYRLDADKFYLKLQETGAPEGFFGITKPIWIKAVRNAGTNEMQYSIAKAPSGVSVSVGADGLLTVSVKNAAVPGDVVIPGNKIVRGDSPPDEIFYFDLVQVANGRGAPYTAGEPIRREAEIKGGGSFAFPAIKGLTEGVYYFAIRERLGTAPNWTYDERIYIATVYVGGSPLTYKVVGKVQPPPRN